GPVGMSSDERPRQPTVTLHDAGDAEVGHFALLSLPVDINGQPDGRLLVYLDQSSEASAFSRYFGLIAAIMLLLLGAGLATAISFAWSRSRERQAAEEQVLYLE